MENYRVDKLRAELNQLLKKQSQVLESRSLGSATDTELLEYEIRQEIVHELCVMNWPTPSRSNGPRASDGGLAHRQCRQIDLRSSAT